MSGETEYGRVEPGYYVTLHRDGGHEIRTCFDAGWNSVPENFECFRIRAEVLNTGGTAARLASTESNVDHLMALISRGLEATVNLLKIITLF
jgi:hypothetical protein